MGVFGVNKIIVTEFMTVQVSQKAESKSNAENVNTVKSTT